MIALTIKAASIKSSSEEVIILTSSLKNPWETPRQLLMTTKTRKYFYWETFRYEKFLFLEKTKSFEFICISLGITDVTSWTSQKHPCRSFFLHSSALDSLACGIEKYFFELLKKHSIELSQNKFCFVISLFFVLLFDNQIFIKTKYHEKAAPQNLF